MSQISPKKNAGLSKKVVRYVKLISASWQKAVNSILSVASLLKEAEQNLSHAEWYDLVGELPFSAAAANKLLAIAEDKRLNNPKNSKHLPPHWTTLYEISTLGKDAFVEGLKDGLISPKVKRRDVVAFKNEFAMSQMGAIATTKKSIAIANATSRFAFVTIPPNFDLRELHNLRKSLARLADKFGFTLEFDKSKSGIIAREREELAVTMEEWLEKHSKTFNKGISQEAIEDIEDTFFQLRNEREYHPDPATGKYVDQDIRSLNHPFHGRTAKDMYDYCRGKKIVTRFTPIKELDKTAYVKGLVLQHSRGDSVKRADVRKKLQRLIKRGNEESRNAAQDAMDILIEFGS